MKPQGDYLRKRQPHILRVSRRKPGKGRVRYSNDREWHAVELYGLSDCAWGAAKGTLPVPITEDRHGFCAGPLVAGFDASSRGRLNSERLEIIARDNFSARYARRSVSSQVELCRSGKGPNAREYSRMLADFLEHRIGEGATAGDLFGPLRPLAVTVAARARILRMRLRRPAQYRQLLRISN